MLAVTQKEDTFQTRLIQERNDLQDRTNKLQMFIDTLKFKELEAQQRYLLRRQLVVHMELLSILEERLELLGFTV